jgi:uncharacterized OB-fold protein
MKCPKCGSVVSWRFPLHYCVEGTEERLRKDKTLDFDGPCPFLSCVEDGPHEHPVCEKCGAVRYGNMFCERCREEWKLNQPHKEKKV